uniref:beta-ketoacyl-[acyl-carrier-protein] synthase I n=1 Tax=Caenorhabditis japonica TaxID=281687 RepID=A0A8R1DY33_CAEJA
MHRVVITGMGAISPFGVSVNTMRNGLNGGQSALKYDEALKFVVGAVSGEPVENRWPVGKQREMSKASMFALVASEEALLQAKAENLEHEETSVNIGTCMSDLLHIGETAQKVADGQTRKVSPYFVPRILNNLPAGYVAMKYKMRGGVEATSTACATGLHCIGNAFHSIRHGTSRRALAGAVECALNPIALAGFDRMRALAKGTEPNISRPFDKKRAGFVLSEGAGLVFMERLEDAQARGASILAEVLGYGISSDCYHISTPDPSAIGAVLSMRRAIKDSKGLEPQEISYVNAHATSTPNGDSVEAEAVRQVFPDQNIAVSSVKGHIGHLLGAAGAVETIATICAMNDNILLANLNLEETEDGDGMHILRENEKWTGETKISICNSFGFGATNASLVFRQF